MTNTDKELKRRIAEAINPYIEMKARICMLGNLKITIKDNGDTESGMDFTDEQKRMLDDIDKLIELIPKAVIALSEAKK